MEFYNKMYCVEVWGPWACFTRPELKVERVSYDVMTPSAARGILSSIFWKPAIRWKVKALHVLEPIRWCSIRRNEVGATMSPRSPHLLIEDNRQQRAAMILQQVRYRIFAELAFIAPARRKTNVSTLSEALVEKEEARLMRGDENPGKYYGIFERRMRKGQYFLRPYLGCREFSCEGFRLIECPEEEERQPIEETRDLGIMLYDMDFSDAKNPQPAFFRASMERGRIVLPDWGDEAVLR